MTAPADVVDEHPLHPAGGVNFLLLAALINVLPAKESLQEMRQIKIDDCKVIRSFKLEN